MMAFSENGEPGLEEIIDELFKSIEYESREILDFIQRRDSITSSMREDRERGVPTEDANQQLSALQDLVHAEIGDNDQQRDLLQIKFQIALAKIYYYGKKPNACLNNLEEARNCALAYQTKGSDLEYRTLIDAINELLELIGDTDD